MLRADISHHDHEPVTSLSIIVEEPEHWSSSTDAHDAASPQILEPAEQTSQISTNSSVTEKAPDFSEGTLGNNNNSINKAPYAMIAEIPTGRKDGTYFVLNNTNNINKRKGGNRSDFWDDCGAWQNAASPGAPVAQWVKRWPTDLADRVRSSLEVKSSHS